MEECTTIKTITNITEEIKVDLNLIITTKVPTNTRIKIIIKTKTIINIKAKPKAKHNTIQRTNSMAGRLQIKAR